MKPCRVYLVDDNAPFVRAVYAFLDSYETVEGVGAAGSGREALAQAPCLQPDVVLLDAWLPDLCAPQLVPALHARLPQAAIIVWTLHDVAAYRRMAQKAGADGFIPKDKLVKDLVVDIERAVQARRRPREAADASAVKPGDGCKEV